MHALTLPTSSMLFSRTCSNYLINHRFEYNFNSLSLKEHLKDRISKDLTSGVVYKFQCGLCNGSYWMCEVLECTNMWRHWYATTYQKASSLRMALQVIIHYFLTIHHPVMILGFWDMRTSLYWCWKTACWWKINCLWYPICF